jgi:hypothetical protein
MKAVKIIEQSLADLDMVSRRLAKVLRAILISVFSWTIFRAR